MNFKEFKPALLFVGKFLVIYLVLNTLYGLYITSFEDEADTVTAIVTEHSAGALRLLGFEAETGVNDRPSIPIYLNGERTVSVFEGCNSLNVIIVMLAFLVAYQGKGKYYLWFVPLSIVIIYIANLVRIDALVFVNVYLPDYMYFTHKYFFTAFIYAVVFLLWFWWVRLNGSRQSAVGSSTPPTLKLRRLKKTEDGRRKTGDGRRETGDERREREDRRRETK